jgi:hypothetical protein
MTDPAPTNWYYPHCPQCIPLGPWQEGETRYDLSLHPWLGSFESGRALRSDLLIASKGDMYPNVTLGRLEDRRRSPSGEWRLAKFREAAHRAYIKGLLPPGYPKVWESQP